MALHGVFIPLGLRIHHHYHHHYEIIFRVLSLHTGKGNGALCQSEFGGELVEMAQGGDLREHTMCEN